MKDSPRVVRSHFDWIGLLIRRGLFILSGLSCGLGMGAIGTYYLLDVTVGPDGPDNWGAAPFWILMMAVNGIIGSLAGGGFAFSWVRQAHIRSYRPFDWLGILLGMLLSLVAYQLIPDRYYFYFRLLFMAILVPLCVIVCRFLVGDIVASWLVPSGKSEDTKTL